MKQIKKIAFLSILLIICLVNITYGFSVRDLTGTDVTISEAQDFGGKIMSVLTTIGSVLSIVILIAIGIKYMTGSVEEKAEYKKSLMPYVIGCILVFAASTIAEIIYQISPK